MDYGFFKNLLLTLSLLFLGFAFCGIPLYAQNFEKMHREAERHYSDKEYNRAIVILLDILEMDSENDRAQRRIENIFEIKQKKALTLEMARLNFSISLMMLDDDSTLDEGIRRGRSAIQDFITAYRLDPNDPDMQELLADMRMLESEVKAAEERQRVAYAKRERARILKENAREAMDADPPEYETALQHWEDALEIFPNDTEALEGARETRLALENFIRFQNIRRFMSQGDSFFEEEEFVEARSQYRQALDLDPQNREARRKIALAGDKISEMRNLEQRREQAENYYRSAQRNLSENRFDLAKDDFQNSLALVPGYRDAERRLEEVEVLRERYRELKEQERLDEINRLFQSGILYLNEANYSEAISAFERTLDLDPENQLAERYLVQAREAQSVIAEEVVDRDSQYYDIVQSLIASGTKLYEQENYAESRKRWERILSLFPQNRVATEYILRCDLNLDPQRFESMASSMVEEGREYIKKREFERAYRLFDLIKSVRSDYPDIDRLMAQAQTEQKQTRVTRLDRSDREEVNRRYRLGLTYFQRGGKENIERSAEEFRFVIQNDPNHTQAIVALNRAEAQLRRGGIPAAASAAPQKRELTPEQQALVRKHYFQGISYYSNNDYNNAIAEWRKVLAIDPDHEQARNNIRRSMALLGR